MLPALLAYLGMAKLASTERYLRMVPGKFVGRLARFWAADSPDPGNNTAEIIYVLVTQQQPVVLPAKTGHLI